MRYAGLYSMDSAHRDDKPILLFVKDQLPAGMRWAGQVFVGKCKPGASYWRLAAPVENHAWFPDDWLKGWMPVPEAGREIKEEGDDALAQIASFIKEDTKS